MTDSAAGQTFPDPSVLGRILLLQSTLQAAPNEQRLAEQACHALGGIDVLSAVAVCIDGGVCCATGFAGIEPEECCRVLEHVRDDRDKQCALAGHEHVDCLVFQVGENHYGGLLIASADDSEYELYRPYISNTANLIALMLDNIRQGKQLKELNQTLEKRVEERTSDLQYERDKAQNYLDIAGVLLMVIGSDQNVTMINRKGCEILGYSEQEILGCNWIEKFIPEHDQDTIKALFNQSMVGEIVPEDKYENPIVAKDGQLKLIAWNNNFLKDSVGQIIGVLSSGEDITEKRRWEDLIHNVATGVSGETGEGFFRSLVRYLGESLEVDYALIGEWSESGPDQVKTVSVYARGELVDNFEYDLAGTPCANVVGQHPCVHAQGVQQRFPEDLLLVKMGVDSYAGVPLFDSNNKPLGILAVLDAKPCENAELFTSVLQIFAGRVAAELERSRVEAERENLIAKLGAQNEEMERFVYTVSHDLKTPLVTIKGFAGMLKADIGDKRYEDVDDSIERICSSADRMHRLLQELLELSRIGRMANDPEEVSFGELAEEVVQTVSLEHGVQSVDFRIAEGMPVVIGDRVRLLEMLQNLVDNAVKYASMQAQGVVEIGVKHSGSKFFGDGGVQDVFFVRDNGQGIEPKYHARVFELFYRLDADTEGTGVGLAIVKRIVEYHGGEIWVESDGEGGGCEFNFTLSRIGEKVEE